MQAALRSCEQKLIERIRAWALPYGSREVTIRIEYQDHVPVMIRVLEQLSMQEERLR